MSVRILIKLLYLELVILVIFGILRGWDWSREGHFNFFYRLQTVKIHVYYPFSGKQIHVIIFF